MEGFCVTILVIFGLMQTGCLGQQDVTVSVTPSDKVLVKTGTEKFQLVCEVSTDDFQFYIDYMVKWVHIKKTTKVETVLSINFHPASDLEAGKYTLEHKHFPVLNAYRFTLTVNKVDDDDVGDFICQIEKDNIIAPGAAKVAFDVAHPIDEVLLKFPNKRVRSRVADFAPLDLEVLEGDYQVICEARGSNPAPVLNLLLDGKPVENVPDIVSIPETRTRLSAHKSSVTTTIAAMAKDNRKIFECVASVPGVDYPRIVASMKFLITSITPHVHCSNLTTIRGNQYAEIKCNATSLSSIDCKSINWEITTKDQPMKLYNANNKTQEYEFKCQPINDMSVEVWCVINEVKAYHFETLFALDISVGGSKHREHVVVAESGWSGASPFRSVLWVVLAVGMAVWKLL